MDFLPSIAGLSLVGPGSLTMQRSMDNSSCVKTRMRSVFSRRLNERLLDCDNYSVRFNIGLIQGGFACVPTFVWKTSVDL
jgi:hypothetical protein